MLCFKSKTKKRKEKDDKKGKKSDKPEHSEIGASEKQPEEQKSEASKESLEVPVPLHGELVVISDGGKEESPRPRGSGFWESETGTFSTSSSAPVLFRFSPVDLKEDNSEVWDWWHEQVRRGKLTSDGYSKRQLHDLQNRLRYQYDENPSQVEMDVSNCYLERTAPFVLGQLLSTPQPSELRHITSLRLDGNYFSNDGLANALSSIAEECERTVLFPVLEQLYLNNMNLDSSAVSGVLSFLFPIDRVAAQRFSVQLPAVPEVFQRPHTASTTPAPIFPAIKVLCLSDNPGLGTAGFTCVLQHLLTSHFSDHQLSVLDLSRCDLDKKCGKPLKQYVKEIDEALAEGTFPVVTQNIVLMGNARFKVPNHSEGTTKIVI